MHSPNAPHAPRAKNPEMDTPRSQSDEPFAHLRRGSARWTPSRRRRLWCSGTKEPWRSSWKGPHESPAGVTPPPELLKLLARLHTYGAAKKADSCSTRVPGAARLHWRKDPNRYDRWFGREQPRGFPP